MTLSNLQFVFCLFTLSSSLLIPFMITSLINNSGAYDSGCCNHRSWRLGVVDGKVKFNSILSVLVSIFTWMLNILCQNFDDNNQNSLWLATMFAIFHPVVHSSLFPIRYCNSTEKLLLSC